MNGNKETPLTRSVGNITWVVSALITFGTLLDAHAMTNGWVVETAAQYTRDISHVRAVSLIWLGLCAVLIFSLSRAVMTAVLAAGGLTIIMRLFGNRD